MSNGFNEFCLHNFTLPYIGSWNTRHNKHAKNTCHGHAKEALAIALNFLKLFWSAVVRQEIEGDFVTTISPVC